MAWRLRAVKGYSIIESGGRNKELILDHARKLREKGYRVKVRKVRG